MLSQTGGKTILGYGRGPPTQHYFGQRITSEYAPRKAPDITQPDLPKIWVWGGSRFDIQSHMLFRYALSERLDEILCLSGNLFAYNGPTPPGALSRVLLRYISV